MLQITLLLLLSSAFLCASPSEARSSHVRQLRATNEQTNILPLAPEPFPGVLPLGILPNPAMSDPKIRKCWLPFRNIPGCGESLFESSTNPAKLHLGSDCCKEVMRMSPECFYKIFYELFQSDFSFGPRAKDYCTTHQFGGDGGKGSEAN